MGTRHGAGVDRVVVDRLVRGVRVPANRAELAAATAVLDRMEFTAREIGQRLGRDRRSVERYRAANRARV